MVRYLCCDWCGRQLNSSRGHSLHVRKCVGNLSKRRVIASIVDITNNTPLREEEALPETNNESQRFSLIREEDDDEMVAQISAADDIQSNERHSLSRSPRLEGSNQSSESDGASSVESSEMEVDTNDDELSLAASCLPDKRSTRLLSSNTTATEVDTYRDVTSRDAGTGFLASGDRSSDVGSSISGSTDQDSGISEYHPFKNATDYAFARWLSDAKCSRRDVDRFFSNKRLSPLHDYLSFRSADKWMEMLHSIPYGIEDDR